MKFKMPKIQNLVCSDNKLDASLPQKLIHVVQGHAIVNHKITVVVNLREYVKKECKITEQDDLDKLTGIIDWMNDKSFDKSFWSELVKENFVEVTPDGLELESVSYNKILVYEDIITDNIVSLQSVRDNLARKPVTLDRVAFHGALMIDLMNVFKSEMKNDSFLFDFTGKENIIKFSGRSKDYIFGFIPLKYDDSTELTAFHNTENFANVLSAYMGG